MPKYRVTLSPEIAKRKQWTGTRRRTVTTGPNPQDRKTFVFGHKPVVIDELYPEIARDPMLHVVEIDAAEAEPEADSNATLRETATIALQEGVAVGDVIEVPEFGLARVLEIDPEKGMVVEEVDEDDDQVAEVDAPAAKGKTAKGSKKAGK